VGPVSALAEVGQGPHRAAPDLDVDPAEGPLRRAGEDGAARRVQEALVAGALQPAAAGREVDDAAAGGALLAAGPQLAPGEAAEVEAEEAAEVLALLAEGPQLAPGEVDEDRRIGAGRVVEEVGGALGHVGQGDAGPPLALVDRAQGRPQGDPDVAGREPAGG